MQIIRYLSVCIIPFIIVMVLICGLKEKKKVFDLFIKGAKDGMKIVIHLFPTLIGIFLATGALRNSGILELFIKIISPITNIFKFPNQILPLAMLRPISGSASMGMAIDIMNKYGVDNILGLIASVIMESTETTLYTIAIYTACVKIKIIRFILVAALLADLAGIITSIVICNIMF